MATTINRLNKAIIDLDNRKISGTVERKIFLRTFYRQILVIKQFARAYRLSA